MNDYEYPACDEIEPEQARYLFENCAILIIEQLPIGSEFGIDLFVYKIGEKFKGVKLIPPGIHFVYASGKINTRTNNSNDDLNTKQGQSSSSSVNINSPSVATSQIGPRCGFYHNFKPKELIVKRWSTEEEEFDLNYCISVDEHQRYHCNLKDLDPFLGTYRYSSYKAYLNLTNHFSPEIVESLVPKIKLIRSVPYLIESSQEKEKDDNKRIKRLVLQQPEKPSEDNLLSNMKPDKNTVINFTKIPDNHLDSKEPISPEMITQYNLDSTQKLETNFELKDSKHLLAELQFSFLTFLLCHVYDCFEHWKSLLTVICLAEKGLTKYPLFFIEFVDILRNQFDHIPEDMFDDIVDTNNLARTILDTFFQNINDLGDCDIKNVSILKEKASQLKKHLEEKFNWQFELELDDEQPVIVSL